VTGGVAGNIRQKAIADDTAENTRTYTLGDGACVNCKVKGFL